MTPTRHAPHPSAFEQDWANDPTCPFWFDSDHASVSAALVLAQGYDVHEYCAALARAKGCSVGLYATRPHFLGDMTPADVQPTGPDLTPERREVSGAPLLGLLRDLEATAGALLQEALPTETLEAVQSMRSSVQDVARGDLIDKDWSVYSLLKLQEFTVLRRLGVTVFTSASPTPAPLRLVPLTEREPQRPRVKVVTQPEPVAAPKPVLLSQPERILELLRAAGPLTAAEVSARLRINIRTCWTLLDGLKSEGEVGKVRLLSTFKYEAL